MTTDSEKLREWASLLDRITEWSIKGSLSGPYIELQTASYLRQDLRSIAENIEAIQVPTSDTEIAERFLHLFVERLAHDKLRASPKQIAAMVFVVEQILHPPMFASRRLSEMAKALEPSDTPFLESLNRRNIIVDRAMEHPEIKERWATKPVPNDPGPVGTNETPDLS